MSQIPPIVESLPTEIYFKIFKFLRVPDLIHCRAVCKRWKDIIDVVTRSQEFWNEHCVSDFKDTYEVARRKSAGVSEECLYRSLHLWSKLSCAEEERDEFCFASAVREEILGFTLLRNDVIGVHKRSGILYYNAETFRPVRRNPVFGAFEKYAENDDVIFTQDSHLRAYVIDKHNGRHPMVLEAVKTFLLLEKVLYYVDMSDDVYMWVFNDTLPKKLGHSEEGVISLGFKNQLYILTCERSIYTVDGDRLKLVLNMDQLSNLVDVLHRYNMLPTVNWRLFFQWLFLLNHSLPEGLLQDIITIRGYGDVYFVGTTWGVLRIYYRPYILGKFDIFNSLPIKQYNFMETCDCPVLSMCQIISVDCREEKDGHTVFVAMPKKIAVLKYKHIFKTLSRGPIYQLIELQPMQMINVD